MNIHTIVKTATLTSLLIGSLCQADAATGLPTGKRQHKPLTITQPVDAATPAVAQSAASAAKTKATTKGRAGYRLCPDGTMIHPGEKCPEKSSKK